MVTSLLDSGIPVGLLLVDHAKAFNKVPCKCSNLFHPNLVEYKVDFTSWCTVYTNFSSSPTMAIRFCQSPYELISGMPQSLVLDPTLFLIYISEIENKQKT